METTEPTPFRLLGDPDQAAVCVDGVCAVPAGPAETNPEQPDED